MKVVASPTYTHKEIVTKSLAAKKAVFCEKPVAETREDTEKCYDVAKQCGKPLFTAFNRRFDPSYEALRQRVKNGEVGHVHTLCKCTSSVQPEETLAVSKIASACEESSRIGQMVELDWASGELPSDVSPPTKLWSVIN